MDARDPAIVGGFWAAVLGLRVEQLADGDVVLRGATPRQTLWINRVPEPKTVKHRMHFDVRVHSAADLEKLGATVVAVHDHWTIMTDPEGGEFCAFPSDSVPEYPLFEVVIDAADPQAQARWWAELLGARAQHDAAHPWWWVEGLPDAPFEYLVFNAVPESKTVKNRLHIDVTADAVEPIVEQGATLVRPEGGDIRWSVLADPEGNEFCVFVTRN